jgi:lipopolysaccharide biosynthesis protein
LEQGASITQREKQMSYGVSITVKYTETTSTGTITKETNYNFHVDTASNASDLISQTAKNAKEMKAENVTAEVTKVAVTDERKGSFISPFNGSYKELTDGEILDLLLTK